MGDAPDSLWPEVREQGKNLAEHRARIDSLEGEVGEVKAELPEFRKAIAKNGEELASMKTQLATLVSLVGLILLVAQLAIAILKK